MNKTVSVIVPCYNMEQYVANCLDSLLANEYEDKEIIVVDDGSTDRTLSILHDYEKRHACIHVVSKRNGGVSTARNTGLDVAKGEFVMFADPDDKVCPTFIATAVKAITSEGGFDAVQFGFDTNKGWTYLSNFLGEYHSNDDILQHYFPKILGHTEDSFQQWVESGRLDKFDQGQIFKFILRNSIIHRYHLRFPPHLIAGEDQMFISEYLIYAESLKNIPDVLYHYIIREDGALRSNISGVNVKKTLDNKVLLLEERIRLATIYREKVSCIRKSLYAGSILLSCLQLGALAARRLSSYSILSTYAHLPEVECCIDGTLRDVRLLKNIKSRGAKRTIPLWLLKRHCYKTLFIALWIAQKLGIKATE